MANLVDAYEKKILDGLTGVTSLFTGTMYMALFTSDPTDSGGVGSELVGGGYARKSLAGLFPSASGASVANTSAIDFATATSNWAEVTHVGFMESGVATTDDMAIWLLLDTPITIQDTQVFSFAIAKLTITAS